MFVGVLLAGCAQPPLGFGGNEPPDALDRVRAVDLQPRFPLPSETVNTGSRSGAAAQPSLYYGNAEAPAERRSGPLNAASGAGEGVDLNFENTPVTAVAKVILGDILKVGYSIDPRVQGTVSLSSGRPVPKADLLFVLESALQTSNTSLLHDAAGYHIVPSDEAIGGGRADRATGGHALEPGYGITVIPLQHVSVQTIMKLLEGFAAKAGSVRADPATNLIVVVGNGLERRAAVETVLSFDADWMRGQSVGIFPVHNTTPEPLVAELEKILDSGEAGLSQNLVKLQAVNRLNAILVVARKPELLRTASNWISRLDGSAIASTGVKVYRVRYGDARQIAKLLGDLFAGGGGGGLESAANQIAPGARAASLSGSAGGGSASGGGLGGAGGGGGGFGAAGAGAGAGGGAAGGPFGGGAGGGAAGGAGAGATSGPFGALSSASGQDSGASGFANASISGRGGSGASAGPALLPGVRIMADVANNAVVIYANPENFRIIERALTQLDRPQLQVAIDLTIAEVSLNDQLNYGVQFFLGSSNFGLGANNGSVANTALSIPLSQTNPGTLPGFNLVLGNQLSPHAIINALHQYTDVKILSNPSLVVVDNQVASLQVGDSVPVTTQSGQSTLASGAPVLTSIDYRNTGIILHVRPRINSNGNVLLDIEQEISNVASSIIVNNAPIPTFTERKVKSSILVMSGQTVLLAGLVSENQNAVRAGVPGLDQIPILGNMFDNSVNKAIHRTELIIFIRPQIIRDGVDASVVAEELRSKMRGNKVGSTQPPGAVTLNPPPALQ